MFPFKVTIYQTIKAEMSTQQIEKFLDIAIEILSKKGAENIFKETNCLQYKNSIFKVRYGWNLMSYTDSGFIEVKTDQDTKAKVIYRITLIRTLIGTFVFALLMLFLTKDIYLALSIFSFFGIISWTISILRHRELLLKIKETYQSKSQGDL